MCSAMLWLTLLAFAALHSTVLADGKMRYGTDENGKLVPLMDTRLKCDFCFTYKSLTTCEGMLLHQVSCEYCATIFQTTGGKNSSIFYGCAEYFSPIFLPVKAMTVDLGGRYIHFCNTGDNCARTLKALH